MVYEDEILYLNATVTNNIGIDYELNEYKINVKDSDGKNILGENNFAVAILFGTLKSKESKILSLSVDTTLSNVYSISYEMVK